MSKQERRRFSREFKLSAVSRLEAGESGSALALELGVKRTILYRWRDAVQRQAIAHRHYGYRRITALLKREGCIVNHKRVARILKEDNLLCLRKPLFRPPTTDSRHSWRVWPNLARHLKPLTIDQLWVADITYGRRKSRDTHCFQRSRPFRPVQSGACPSFEPE